MGQNSMGNPGGFYYKRRKKTGRQNKKGNTKREKAKGGQGDVSKPNVWESQQWGEKVSLFTKEFEEELKSTTM